MAREPLIGIDFDGTLISQAVAAEANRRFFCHLRELLDDPSIPDGSGKDYLQPVLDVMATYHGKLAETEAEKRRYLAEARRFYTVFFLEILMSDSRVVHRDVIRQLRKLHKRGARFALLTTNNRAIIERAVSLLRIADLFELVEMNENDAVLSKEEMMAAFVREHGPLSCYVGDEDGDARAAEKHGLPFFRYVEGRTAPVELERFLESFIP